MGIDPVGVDETNVHSHNRYAYGNNNPYKFTDPNGNSPIDIVFLAVDIGRLGVAAYNGESLGGAAIDVAISAASVFSPVPGVGEAYKAGRAAVALTKAEQFAVNKIAGKAAEARAKDALEKEGYEIIGSQVTVRTADGKIRYVDHLVRKNGELTAIEVKSGKATRSKSQLDKDASIESRGGTIGNRGGDVEGQTHNFRTEERHY